MDGWMMSWTEVAGFATGALCVWLVVRQNVWTFPVGIANNASFIVLFTQAGLYADAGLQVVYIGLGLLGWHWWLRGGPQRSTLTVTRTPRAALPALALGLVAGTVLLTWVLTTYTDSTVAVADAFTTSMSLIAQLMLNRKWIGSWWVWIVVDVVYIALFAYKGLYLTASLYLLFIVLCVRGLVEWRASMRADAVPMAPQAAPEPARS